MLGGGGLKAAQLSPAVSVLVGTIAILEVVLINSVVSNQLMWPRSSWGHPLKGHCVEVCDGHSQERQVERRRSPILLAGAASVIFDQGSV